MEKNWTNNLYNYIVKGIRSVGLLLAFLFLLQPLSAKAGSMQSLQDTFAWQLQYAGEKDPQRYLNGYASDHAENGVVQSYVLALLGDASYSLDYSSYEKALQQVLEVSPDLSPASAQKSLLVLEGIAAIYGSNVSDRGLSSQTIDCICNETIGAKGIMTYIYGLLMLDAGNLSSSTISKEELLSTLLDMQLADGGFAVTGDTGDVDVTAMALQALAPYQDAYQDKIASALSFLDESRSVEGDFSSYGTPSSESTSQVILATCALTASGYASTLPDCDSLVENLMSYHNEDSGFAHTHGQISNDMATSQACYALSALARMEQHQCFLFSFTEYEKRALPTTSSLPTSSLTASSSRLGYQSILSIALIVLWLLMVVGTIAAHLLRRTQNRGRLLRQILSVTLVFGLLLAMNLLVKIEPKDAYSVSSSVEGSSQMQVNFSIEKRTLGEPDIFPPTEVTIPENSSVFELLMKVCLEHKIQVEYEGTPAHGATYIQGIDYLYEFDNGDLSGWMYLVNGEFPSVGCGDYHLQPGDTVRFVYTTNIGKDVNIDD